VFYQTVSNSLNWVLIKCSYISGICVNYGENPISDNVVTGVSPDTSIAASLFATAIGYHVTYQDKVCQLFLGYSPLLRAKRARATSSRTQLIISQGNSRIYANCFSDSLEPCAKSDMRTYQAISTNGEMDSSSAIILLQAAPHSLHITPLGQI